MEKKTIEQKVVERLLKESYPLKLLNGLLYLSEQIFTDGGYSEEEIQKIAPFLKGADLSIESLKQIRTAIKEKLIEQINARAEADAGSLYELAILIFALSNLTYSKKGLKDYPKIRFCYDCIKLVVTLDTNKEQKKMLENLKAI